MRDVGQLLGHEGVFSDIPGLDRLVEPGRGIVFLVHGDASPVTLRGSFWLPGCSGSLAVMLHGWCCAGRGLGVGGLCTPGWYRW